MALALGLVAISLAATPAAAQDVRCGDTIQPGSTVVLKSNLGPCPGPFALRVEGPATLDLGGRTINCLDGTGIEVTGRAAKVRNGNIVFCARGIQLTRGTRHRVSNVRISQTFDAALLVLPSSRSRIEDVEVFGAVRGIVVSGGGNQNDLVGNHVEGALAGGFRVNGLGNELKDNVALRNTEFGFDVRGARHVLVDNEARETRVASPGTGDGFRITGDRTKLTSNSALDNAGNGFELTGASRLRLDKNGAIQNGGFGFLLTANASLRRALWRDAEVTHDPRSRSH